MKSWLQPIPVLFLAVVLTGMATLGACTSKEPATEGFAIYLTKNDISPTMLPAMNYIGLADAPLISGDDIVSYDAKTHEIKLSDEAFVRITELKVPTTGKSFVVCVDNQIKYVGAFWTPISSQSFDGITIVKPLGSDKKVIQIGLGYPGAGFFQGYDTRSDRKILDALEKVGKLVG
ncbi:hypothetical protein [Dehalogenimonas etheniformans]|uniref:Uncharacterized protein n=1 Tax=Dehalogenimonas etheniformans TaxID=1536648 RepID=A0A2P5P795_9CHLR|nr:hypothetical protein [Dehalogenimonas etheniformans]PPD58173.1 hypothetical protein JP09_005115 [Dehalogenimonas etheniformans]QNT75582.1 hypothetical protein HX448_02210 [Dehalogenimonas etheniformans]